MEKVKQFIYKNKDLFSKVLLGLSGGPDSMALFSLLLDAGVNIDVAHVNHGLRAESGREALTLKAIVEAWGIRFIQKNLSLLPEQANMEMRAREERLSFFRGLYEKGGYSALILGHHQDDLVETVLKRVFEGASLLNIGGMKRVDQFEKMTIIRPMLENTKGEIYQYLREKKLEYFTDPTNFAKGNLRSKMREEIIPYLETTFGKNIKSSLLNLAREHQELKENVLGRIGLFIQGEVKGPWGSFVELGEQIDRFDLSMLIRQMAKKRGLVPTRNQVELLIAMHFQKKNEKQVVISNTIWTIERGILFIYYKSCNFELEYVTEEVKAGWKHLWKEPKQAISKKLKLTAPNLQMRHKSGQKLKDWYSRHMVPTFLRKNVPVLVVDKVVEAEFLTNSSFDLNR